MSEREVEELREVIRRVCEAFEMEDGMPFAEVHSAQGVVWGNLSQEATEALQDLASKLEELDDDV